VIGVIKDMVMTSPYDPVKQTIFRVIPYQGLWINIRLNPELSTSEALSRTEKVFQTLVPAIPFEYKFVDQEYALKFSSEERIGKLATFFASLANLISCLGLFGMASFVAEQRKKEIGIRKILGASVVNLWGMLSMEFVILVGISCLIGIPIAWSYLSNWLEKYEYHTEISVWVFVAASAASLIITLLTISFQTIRASIVNPINSLRSE
jgi:putative ABC transport system permease protein